MSRRRPTPGMSRTAARRWPQARGRSFPLCHVRKTLPDVLSRLSPIFARHEVLFFEAFSTSVGFLTTQPYRAFWRATSHSNERQLRALAALQLGPRPL